MSICKYADTFDTAPELIAVGSRSAQRIIFGEDWATKVTAVRKTPDESLERIAARGYEDARAGKPVVELCEAFINTGQQRKLVKWSRVISIQESQKGVKFLLFLELFQTMFCNDICAMEYSLTFCRDQPI